MKINSLLITISTSTLLLAGCASQGNYPANNTTDVRLSGNNYRIVKPGAVGKSYGFYLLGFIPIVSPLASEAKADIYRNVNEPLQGRSIALSNQTQDRSTLYLILFSVPRYTFTADIIEFTGTDQPAK
jgi:hypothetical protein